MQQSSFAAADERGSVVTGLTGQLGRKYGYDFFMSQNVLNIDRAGGSTATVNGAVVKGARHIIVDGAGSGGLMKANASQTTQFPIMSSRALVARPARSRLIDRRKPRLPTTNRSPGRMIASTIWFFTAMPRRSQCGVLARRLGERDYRATSVRIVILKAGSCCNWKCNGCTP